MQTLQSLARAIAAFTDSVQTGGGTGEAAGAAPGARGPAPDLEDMCSAVTSIGKLVLGLTHIGLFTVESAQAPAAPSASKEQRRLAVAQRVFVGEVVGAVADSGILEHLARLVLVSVATRARAQDQAQAQDQEQLRDQDQALDDNQCAGLLYACTAALNGVVGMTVELPDTPACGGGAAGAKLRVAMSGPCALHLTLTAGLAALCLADGGPSHGLPGELLQAMPVLAENSATSAAARDARRLHGRWVLKGLRVVNVCLGPVPGMYRVPVDILSSSSLSRCHYGDAPVVLVRLWELDCACVESPLGARLLRACRQDVAGQVVQQFINCLIGLSQPHPRPPASPAPAPTASLLLRLCHWALASAHAWADKAHAPEPAQEGGDDSGLMPPPLQPLVSRQSLAGSFYTSFCGLNALLDSEQALAAAQGWAGRACAERWVVLVAACRCIERLVSADTDVGPLASLWDPLTAPAAAEEDSGGMLPAQPPAPLPAALAAGLLPCLERLLRRAGQAPHGRDADLAVELLQPHRRCDGLLARLLAYGDPTQAAALVTTLAKLLRCSEVPGSAGRVSKAACSAIALLYARCPAYLGPQPSLGHPQLQRLLLSSAAQWLPPLSARVQALPAFAGGGPRASLTPQDVRERMVALRMHGGPMVMWIQVLLGDRPAATPDDAASAPSDGGSGGASGSGDGPGGDCGQTGDTDDGGGWLRFLQEEVVVAPLLGSLLRAAEMWDPALDTAEEAAGNKAVTSSLIRACALVALTAPEEVARATARGAAAEAAAGSGGRATARPEGGPEGGGGILSGAVGNATASSWRPEAVEALGTKLGQAGWPHAEALAVRLAAVLSRWAQGGGPGCERELAELGAAADEEGVPGLMEEVGWVRRWLPLPPLESVRCQLPACANPACICLDGDSEAGRELRRYPGCGGGAYCSKACAREHGGSTAAGAVGEGGARTK